MIGFQPELLGDIPQADEGLDTRNLEKRELYDMVGAVWFLPPYSSKGVTRDYLLRVHRNTVFRVNTNELKRFEVDISKEAQKKIGTINNALLVRKINILLSVQGLQGLGFSEYEIPESGWLFRVARFIDPTNLLEVFERAVRPEAPLSNQSNPCTRIYYGRLHASSFLFRNQG
jgi:predicted DNA-binding transcriptional regulator